MEQDDLLRMLTHQIHDKLVAYSRIWNRRSLHKFYAREASWKLVKSILKLNLNSAEMDSLTTWRSPMTVIKLMEKCRRMKRPQFLSKNWISS